MAKPPTIWDGYSKVLMLKGTGRGRGGRSAKGTLETTTHLKLPLPLLAHVSNLEHRSGQHCDDEGGGEHLYGVTGKSK